MFRTRLTIIGLILAIIFGLGLLIGFVLPQLARPSSQPTAPFNTATVIRQIQTLSQLVTVKYVLDKVVVLEDVKPWPGGESRVLIVAHGIVKAGVDLSQLKPGDVVLDPATRQATINLPSAVITDVYLDENQTQVVERTTGLLRSFDKNLEQLARRQAVDDLRRAARYGGIVKEGNDRARDQIGSVLTLLGFTQVEVNIR